MALSPERDLTRSKLAGHSLHFQMLLCLNLMGKCHFMLHFCAFIGFQLKKKIKNTLALSSVALCVQECARISRSLSRLQDNGTNWENFHEESECAWSI